MLVGAAEQGEDLGVLGRGELLGSDPQLGGRQDTLGWVGRVQIQVPLAGGGVGGGTLLLESIAAAVIGGVSLFGGRGSIHAALLGALVIGTVSNGLNLMGVENEIRLIVTGLLLVLAVSIDKLIEKATGQQSF